MLVVIGSLALPDRPIHIVLLANHLISHPDINQGLTTFFRPQLQYTANTFNCKTFYLRRNISLSAGTSGP